MKISSFLATGLGVFLFAGAASAATTTYEATLNGPNAGNAGSTATGTATVVLDDVAKTLEVSITYMGFTSPADDARIYTGACGEQGTRIATIVTEPVSTSDTTQGTATTDPDPTKRPTVDDEQITAIKDGNAFVTISSEGAFAFPEFEIRGQLHLADTADVTCLTNTPVDAGTTTPVDAGTTTPTTPDTTTTVDDGGCNSSGTGTNGSSGIVALGLGLAVYGIARKRMKKA